MRAARTTRDKLLAKLNEGLGEIAAGNLTATELQRRPGSIAKMRTEAAKHGLDPDKWFNNVELVVAEKIGMETTTYVRNIYKYYAS